MHGAPSPTSLGRGQRRTYPRGVPLIITILLLGLGAGFLLWRGYSPGQWDQPLIRRAGWIGILSAFGLFVLAVWASFASDESAFARALLSNWFES